MSCFYNDSTKKEIKNFLNEFNEFLRIKNFYIDFSTGNLYHNLHGYCGPLDDDQTVIALVDDYNGSILYETKKLNDD